MSYRSQSLLQHCLLNWESEARCEVRDANCECSSLALDSALMLDTDCLKASTAESLCSIASDALCGMCRCFAKIDCCHFAACQSAFEECRSAISCLFAASG